MFFHPARPYPSTLEPRLSRSIWAAEGCARCQLRRVRSSRGACCLWSFRSTRPGILFCGQGTHLRVDAHAESRNSGQMCSWQGLCRSCLRRGETQRSREVPKDCETEGWEILAGFASLGGALAAPKCLRQVLAASLSSEQPGLSVRAPVDGRCGAGGGEAFQSPHAGCCNAGCLEAPHRPSKAASLTAASGILCYPRKHTSKRVSMVHRARGVLCSVPGSGASPCLASRPRGSHPGG